jgi:hypothetical protein
MHGGKLIKNKLAALSLAAAVQCLDCPTIDVCISECPSDASCTLTNQTETECPKAVCGGVGTVGCNKIDVCAVKQCPGECTPTIQSESECPRAVCDEASSSARSVKMGLMSLTLVVIALVAVA